MDAAQLRLIGIGALYLFVFGSGAWLTRSGKPLNALLLTIHKLFSLAALILIAATIFPSNRGVESDATELGASVVTGLLYLSTIATGALLSTEKPMKDAVLTLHKVTPYLTVIATVVTLYLLMGRQ